MSLIFNLYRLIFHCWESNWRDNDYFTVYKYPLNYSHVNYKLITCEKLDVINMLVVHGTLVVSVFGLV